MDNSRRAVLMKSLLAACVLLSFVALGLLGWVSLPAFADQVKLSREAVAINELREIVTAQNAYRNDPHKGNGQCAANLDELNWFLKNGSIVTDGPERYKFSTDKSCRAIAASENPHSVHHPVVIMDQSRKIKFMD